MKKNNQFDICFFPTFLVAFSLLCAGTLWAQGEVDRTELQRVPGPVEFINNNATTTRIDTREQIWAIGSGLATVGGASESGNRNRYFVIHRLYPPEFDKLDADIFGLGANSEVDHIRNLRLIIQGYLERAYSYSPADAALLAEFITIYNAVYRNNRQVFSTRYKTPIMSDLTQGKEGLSVRYNEWPGQTLMVIPLQTALDGSLSAVDTTVITSEDVVQELRKDDDKGIDQRQQMVDLKEREAEAAAQKAEAQREAAAKQEQQIREAREQLEEQRKEIAEAREQATPEQQNALDKQEEALNQQEEDLNKQEAAVAEQQEAAAANEALAERKQQEAQNEREAISADQRETIVAAAPPPVTASTSTGVLGVRLTGKDAIGTPVIVNLQSGAQMKTSPLNSVNARTVTQTGGKLIASAGQSGPGSPFRLIQINPDTLDTVKTGEDEIQKDSLVWVNGTALYAIVVEGGKSYLGRFNTDLVRQARSRIAVHTIASLLFQGDRILTQSENGAVISLNAQDLTN